MKRLWLSIKPIIYTYIVQYILIFIGIVFYIALTKDANIITNEIKLYNFITICTMISLIPITIYLLKKHKIKETKLEIKKIIPIIILGLNFSLFFNMLTINFQEENPITNLNIILLIIYAVIIAPIFEELLFRYIALKDARKNYQDKIAILIISISFALMHTGIINIIYTFIFGIILSYIYIKYKNIIYPIIMHASANLMSLLISEFNLLYLIISIILLTITIIYIKKAKHI